MSVLENQQLSTAIDEVDGFCWVDKFPDFELVKEFLEGHDVKEDLINFLRENYSLITHSEEIGKKLRGRNIITSFFMAIQLKAVGVFVHCLVKTAQKEEEEKKLAKSIRENQRKALGW